MSISAFPVIPPLDQSGRSPSGYPYPEPGMSLRDYFAAQAMTTMKAPLEYVGKAETEESYRAFAKRAYRIADALLEARENG